MTDSTFSYSDFIPAKSAKKRKNKNVIAPLSTSHSLAQLRNQIRQEEWFTQCSHLLESSWRSLFSNEKPVVLCLGLGSPSSSRIARAQLAFLTETCQLLKVDHQDVSMYDPIFTTEDHLLFKELNMKVTTNNDDVSYHLNVPTICFMPHCDRHLYETLLRSNWNREQLSNMFLVGNHLEAYLENNSKGELESSSPCLLQIAPLFDCRPLPPSDAWPTAFNNISAQFLSRTVVSDNVALNCLSAAPNYEIA